MAAAKKEPSAVKEKLLVSVEHFQEFMELALTAAADTASKRVKFTNQQRMWQERINAMRATVNTMD